MKTYAIARATNKFNPREDSVLFLAHPTLKDAPDMWGFAESAYLFTAPELAEIIPQLEEIARDNWAPDGCSSPDDILLIPGDVALRIEARNNDMGLYDWGDYEGGDDGESQGEWCAAQDIGLVREEKIASCDFAAAILRDAEGACEERSPDKDECAALDRAGYGRDSIEDARVIASTANGARLYRVGADEYCIESETGETIAQLSGPDAIKQWS